MDPRWTNRVARLGLAFTIVLVALWGATIVWALTSASARGAEVALDGGRASPSGLDSLPLART